MKKTPIHTPGYKKDAGCQSERHDMTVEVQSQVNHGLEGKHEACISLRVGVALKSGEVQRLDNLVENCATLTLDQARALAEWLISEADDAQLCLDTFRPQK